MFKTLIIILLGSVFVDNYVLSRFLGICPFLGVSKKIDTAVGMGAAVTFVMGLASAFCFFINKLLVSLDLAFMQTVAFILVIASIVQVVEMFLKKSVPALYKALGIFLPLITTNCAVLGVAINNVTDGYNFIESMVSSLGVGLGFLLAMVLFAGVRSRIENCPAPKCFKGIPITLVAASIVALAFFGFAGVVENLLGA